MTDFSYTTNIPFSTDNPSADQPNMLINTNSINGIIAVDHIGFNGSSGFGGYHNVIHLVNQGGAPTVTASNGQVYTNTANSDQQLFYQSGGGVITQLTGPNAASAGNNGYTWIPGPFLIQWGYVFGTHGSANNFNNGDTGTVTYASSGNISFPNHIYGVWTNGLYNSNTTAIPSSQATVAIDYHAEGKSSFTWAFVTGSSQYTAFFWVAIGN